MLLAAHNNFLWCWVIDGKFEGYYFFPIMPYKKQFPHSKQWGRSFPAGKHFGGIRSPPSVLQQVQIDHTRVGGWRSQGKKRNSISPPPLKKVVRQQQEERGQPAREPASQDNPPWGPDRSRPHYLKRLFSVTGNLLDPSFPPPSLLSFPFLPLSFPSHSHHSLSFLSFFLLPLCWPPQLPPVISLLSFPFFSFLPP